MSLGEWIEACRADEVEVEDVIRFDHGDWTFAIYRTENGDYYASDGFCTHGRFHLSGGLVMGNQIECPKHNGRFDIPTGVAKRVPACVDLKTYPLKIEAGKVFIQL
ncbi:MocE family 2Fe-2S type ferredoxin [Paenibacillus aceris]|uniref:3-phenylpropionate/trans-cinnamate dioxygenase ferredoxin subunit n=1 Tax=Paenibacillus aceris TaxID=869555 RepID=A0ABS4HW48_9BACL|nr:MocE family 2Fe-2S type ferredoxin [Paenibacillus aceris]MBP1962848.1 3-phenylpropionate/trans-cinnamate dioxygenase ferredoxin subunit [Paenibacillus aceris]NHW38275.1 Rieske 2Fe-2S domain-containing protein [Paenibacillus aceris]